MSSAAERLQSLVGRMMTGVQIWIVQEALRAVPRDEICVLSSTLLLNIMSIEHFEKRDRFHVNQHSLGIV